MKLWKNFKEMEFGRKLLYIENLILGFLCGVGGCWLFMKLGLLALDWEWCMLAIVVSWFWFYLTWTFFIEELNGSDKL